MSLWITKTGDEIEYKNLSDSHLLNILKYIERIAIEGREIVVSYGYGGDDNYQTGDVAMIYGDKVLESFNYQALKEEAIARNLIIK